MGDDIVVADEQDWSAGLDEIAPPIGPRFVRSEPRKNAVAYMQGLLSTTGWDPDAVRDDLHSYVVEHLGDRGGVLIVDETGFVKKGDRLVGVTRQYTGTAGRTENVQVGLFLSYATPAGRTFLDRELYLPKS